MDVPDEVRQAALAAFTSPRPGEGVLDLLSDSYDGTGSSGAPADGSVDDLDVPRRLVFGAAGRSVSVLVHQRAGTTGLTVQGEPPVVAVDLLGPDLGVRLGARGPSPLELVAPVAGPMSLLAMLLTEDGREEAWRTSWVTL